MDDVLRQPPAFYVGWAMTWQPINTAPKDGTFVLLGCPNWPYARVGFWGPKFSRYGANLGDAWGKGYEFFDTFSVEPTVWMPLPELPEVKPEP